MCPHKNLYTNVHSSTNHISQKVEVIWKWIMDKQKVSYFLNYSFLAVLCLRCPTQASSSCREWGLLFSCGAWASLSGGFSCCGAQALGRVGSVVAARGLWSSGSVVVAHRLSCSVGCRIFLDQGSNLCLLHWQADSYPLHHQGSPSRILFSYEKNEVLVPATAWMSLENIVNEGHQLQKTTNCLSIKNVQNRQIQRDRK